MPYAIRKEEAKDCSICGKPITENCYCWGDEHYICEGCFETLDFDNIPVDTVEVKIERR